MWRLAFDKHWMIFIRAVIFILGIGFSTLIGTPSNAQSEAFCETNTGVDGVLFNGMFGTVVSPVRFSDVSTEGGGITVHSFARSGQHFLAFAGIERGAYLEGGPIQKAAPEGLQVSMAFLNDSDMVVHRCRVTVAEFDPAVHDIASTAVGNCGLPLLDGVADLRVGEAQFLGLPAPMTEYTSAPEDVIRFSTIRSPKRIVAHGISAGVGHFVYLDEESALLGLCPFVVQAEGPGIDDERLAAVPMCRDVDGTPLDLALGDRAVLENAVYEANHNRWTGSLIIGHERLVSLTPRDDLFDQDGTFEIEARHAGVTMLKRNADTAIGVELCKVLVH